MFKKRDVRGIYPEEVNEANFFRLGKALSALTDRIILGMDYREKNKDLAEHFAAGFGKDVVFIGRCPTGAVAFLSKKGFAVCITASHNPIGYHGAKMFKDGKILSAEEVVNIKHLYEKTEPGQPRGVKLEEDTSMMKEYVSNIPKIENGIFDLGEGAACSVKSIFPKTIFSIPSSSFSGRGPEPKDTSLSKIKSLTTENKQVGFSFDGDADRVVVVVGGNPVRGDIMTGFAAHKLLKKGDGIVLSFDCTSEVFDYLVSNGFKVYYSDVGQEALAKRLEETGSKIAGEMSSHFTFPDFTNYSDAVYFAAVMSDTKSEELENFISQFKSVVSTDTIRGSMNLDDIRKKFSDAKQIENSSDGFKAKFDDFVILVRQSQTEPLIRVQSEAIGEGLSLKGSEFAKARIGELL